MKKTFLLLICLVASFYSKAQKQIDFMVSEVYAEHAQDIVFADSNRYDFIKNLINNRIEILESENEKNVQYEKLSSMSLYNRYNPELKRDEVFDLATFNPLKYNLNFYSTSDVVIYAIDNTNYILVIHPQTHK